MLSKAGHYGYFVKYILVFIIGPVLLSGCATRDPRLLEALKTARITEIQVEATPDVRSGLPMINGITQQQQIAMILDGVRTVASRELKGYPNGPNPSRLIITLQQADLASMAGRVLLTSDSWIMGTVRLEDISTGRLVAQKPRIRGSDHGVRGTGLAAFAAVVINAATTKSQAALVEKLAISFISNVKAWLDPNQSTWSYDIEELL